MHRAAGHGSSEYRHNAALIMAQTIRMLQAGVQLQCGICGRNLAPNVSLSVDHVIRLRDGGSHEPQNLRVVHARCNSSDH